MNLLSRDVLRPRQQQAIVRLDAGESMMLLADMGTGKTIIAQTNIVDQPAPTLVIAPKRVAELQWRQEAALWEHTIGLDIQLAVGTPAHRSTALGVQADLHLINIENTQWLVDNFDLTRWDRIIFDELSLWKGGAKRWKAIRKKLEHAQRIGLTGTPATNGLLGVWPMAKLIDSNSLQRTKTAYKQKYFYQSDFMGYNWKPFPGSEEAIFKALEPITFRIENDTAEMPELMVNTVPVLLPEVAHDAIKDLTREFITQLDGEVLTASSVGVLTGKVQQIANGRLYTDEGDGTSVHIHSAKTEACTELVESLNGEPVIICYTYKHDLVSLQAAFPDVPTFGQGDDAKLVDDWNAGKLPVVLGQPQAFGHGINLQKGGGHHIIWYGLNWSLDYFDQTIARLWRPGQTAGVVFVHVLSAVDTIDEDIFTALKDKASVQTAMLDYFGGKQ